MNDGMAIQDIFFIGVMFFAVVITVLIVGALWFGMSSELDTALDNADASTAIRNVNTSFNVLDYTFFTLAIGMPIAAMILAFFVPVNPIFTFIAIFVIAIFMIIFPQFANVYVEIATQADITSTLNPETRWPLVTFIMQNYPLYMTISSALVILALFAKPAGE